MNQVIHNQIKKVSAVMAAVLLSLTLASCGGGGGGGSTSSNPLAPGGQQATGNVKVVIPGTSRGSAAARNASLIPAGASNFLVQVVDFNNRNLVLGFADADRTADDQVIEVNGIPAGMVFVKVFARAADRTTVLAISEDVASVIAGQSTPVAAVMGVSIRQVESAGGVKSIVVEPSSFTVKQGDTLVIGNTSPVPVKFSTDDPGAKFSLGLGGFSKQFRVIVSDPGTYTFNDASGATFTLTVNASSGAIPMPLAATVGPLFGRTPHDLSLSVRLQGDTTAGLAAGSVLWDFQDGNVGGVSFAPGATDPHITRKTYEAPGTYVVRLCAVETGTIASCGLSEAVPGLVRDFKFNVSVDRPAATVASADYLALDVGNEWSYQMFDYLAADGTSTSPTVRAASQLATISGTEVLPDVGASGPQPLVKKVSVVDAGETKNGFAAKIVYGIVDANRDGVNDASDGAFEKHYFYVDAKGDYNLYRIQKLRPSSGVNDPGTDFDFTLEPPMVMAKASMTEGQSVTATGTVAGTQAGGTTVSGTYSSSITFVSFHPVGAIAGFFDDAVQIDRRVSFTVNGETHGEHDVANYARGTGLVLRSDLQLLSGLEVPAREDVLVHAVVDGLEIGGSAPGAVPAGDLFPLVSLDDHWIYSVGEFSEPATGFPSAQSAAVRASKALARRKAGRSASVLAPGQRLMQAKLRELIPGNNGVTAVVERIYDNNGDVDQTTGEPIFDIHDGKVETDVYHVEPGAGVLKVSEGSADFAQINKNEPFKQVSGERRSFTPGIPELTEPVVPNLYSEGTIVASQEQFEEASGGYVPGSDETWTFEYETLLVPEPVDLGVGYFENLFVVSRLSKKFNSAGTQIAEYLEMTFLAPGVGPVLKTDMDVYSDSTGQLVSEFGFAELLSARVAGLDFGVPPAGDGSPYVMGTYPYDGEFQFPILNPQFAVFFSEPMQGDFSTASLTFQKLEFGTPGVVRAFRRSRQGKVVCDPTLDPNCVPTCDPTLDPNCQPPPTCDPTLDPNCVPTCDPTLDPNCIPPPTCDPALDPNCTPYTYQPPTLGPAIIISGDSVRPILASDLQPTGRYAGRKLPRGAKVLPTDIIGLSFTYNGELEQFSTYQVSAIDIPATLLSTATGKALRQPVIDQPIIFGTAQGGFIPSTGGVPHAVAQLPGIGGNAPPDGQFAFIYDQIMDTTQLPTAFSFTLESFDPVSNAPTTTLVDETNYQSMDIGHWVWMFDGQADKLTFFLHSGFSLVNGQNYTLTWNVFPDVKEQSLQVASDATTYIDVWPTVDFMAGFSAGPGPFSAMGQFPQSGYGMAQGAALEFFYSDFVDTTQLPTTFEFTLTDNVGTATTINAANASQYGYWGWGSGFSGEPKLSFFPNTETSLVDVSLAPYTLTWTTFPDVFKADTITAADYGLMETLVSFDVFPGGIGPGPGGAPAITFFHPMEGGMLGERTSIFISFVGGINDAYTPSQFLFQIADNLGTITTIDANNAADYGHWQYQFTPNFEAQLHFVLDGPINLLTQAGSPYSITWLQAPDVMPFDFSQVVDYSALPIGVPINFSVQAGGGVPGTFAPVMAFPGPSGAMVPEGSMFFFNFPPSANTAYLPQTFAFEVTDAASNAVTIDPVNASNYGTWTWGTTTMGDPQLQFVLNGPVQLLSQAAGPYTLNWLQFPDALDFSGQLADFSMLSPVSMFDVGPPGPIGPGPGPGGSAATGLFPNNGDTMVSGVTIDIYYGVGVDTTTLPTSYQFTLNGTTYDATTFIAAGGNVMWTSNMMGAPTLAFMPPTGVLIDNSSNTLVWNIFPDVYDAATLALADHSVLGALPLNITFGVTTGGPGPGPVSGSAATGLFPNNGDSMVNTATIDIYFGTGVDTTTLPTNFQFTLNGTTYDPITLVAAGGNVMWTTNMMGAPALAFTPPTGALIDNSSNTLVWSVFPDVYDAATLAPADVTALGALPLNITFGVTTGGPGPGPGGPPMKQYPAHGQEVPYNMAGVSFVFDQPMDQATLPSAFQVDVVDNLGATTTVDTAYATSNSLNWTWSTNAAGKDILMLNLPPTFLNPSPGSSPYTFNWINFPQGLQYSALTPVDWSTLAVSQSVTVTVGTMTKAVATTPPDMAINIPIEGTAFDIIFNNSMDNTLFPTNFSFQITNTTSGGIFTIDQTNYTLFGTFTWNSGVLPNDQLTFQLSLCSALTINGVPCLNPSSTYSVMNSVAPTNLMDANGGSVDTSGMPTSGMFTTGTGAPL